MSLPATLHKTPTGTALAIAEGFGVYTSHDAHLKPAGDDNTIHATKFPVKAAQPYHINRYHEYKDRYSTTESCTLDVYGHSTPGESGHTTYIPTTIDPTQWGGELVVHEPELNEYYTVHRDNHDDMCNLISAKTKGYQRTVKKESDDTITQKIDVGDYIALMPLNYNP